MSAALDSDQIAAVESTAPVTVVAAGPGAGKTHTLVARIKWLVAMGVAPSSIVCMTFTNAGARELAGRLGQLRLGYIGTLHGYCFRILQQRGGRIGYREGGINMLPEDLTDELLREAAKFLHYKGSDKALREARDFKAQMVHKEYRFRLKTNNLVDYDGCLVDALKLITAGEAPSYSELLVDEAQDSAEIDWEIYEAINVGARFIIGDEKQSIFGFRGAHPRGFTDAATAGNHVVKLQRNYRSGSRITAAATRLIGHNPGLLAAETISATGTQGLIGHSSFATDAAECLGVSGVIYGMMTTGGYDPNEVAVLCRTNGLCSQFRATLQAAGVPVRGGRQERLPSGFGHAMDVLSLLADPRSDIMAERVMKILAPSRVEWAKANAIMEGRWLSEIAFGDAEATSDMSKLCATLPRWDVDKECCDLVADRIAKLPMPEPTLADLRHDLFDYAKYGGEPVAEAEGVTVCTVHASKGREWPVVFIPGVEQEEWGRGDLEESRRLMFVAVTRAKSEVHLSSATTRAMQWGGMKPRTTSQFISELGLA